MPAVDPALLSATTELTRKMFGDIPVIPTMSTGATDSHWLREAGIPSYGISGIFSLPGETNAHGRDEKLQHVWVFTDQKRALAFSEEVSG